MMIRTQVQFTQEQWEELKKLAAARRLSVAELVRQGVDQLLRAPENMDIAEYQRLTVEIAGKYHSGSSDISTKHDQYLAETYGS